MEKYDLSKLDENFSKAKEKVDKRIETAWAFKVSEAPSGTFSREYRNKADDLAHKIATKGYSKAKKAAGDDFELGG